MPESSPNTPISTPDIPASKAKLSLRASTFANTKASLCFTKVVDSAVWRDWNELCPEVIVRSQPPGTDHHTSKSSRNLSVSIAARGRVTSVQTNGSISLIEKINEDSREEEDDESGRTSDERLRDSGIENRDSNDHAQKSERTREDSESVDPLDQSSALPPPPVPPKKTSFEIPDPDLRKVSLQSNQPNRANDPDAPYTGRLPTNNASSRLNSVSLSANPNTQPRLLSVSSIYNEPSVHLHKGTAMTLHYLFIPSKPRKIKKIEMVVTDLHRPGATHLSSPNFTQDKPAPATTKSPTTKHEVYRIIISSDTSLAFPSSLPKWLRYTQRVIEIRPILGGDGSEECEISMCECQRGLLARFMGSERKKVLRRGIEQNVKGLKGACEGLGGKVDRRDWGSSS